MFKYINKTVISALTIFAVVFIPTISLANDSIKHNASCTVKNKQVVSKNIIYKCSPVNKKLVWRALGKTHTAIPKPVATSTNAFVPWSDKFEIKPMVDAASNNFNNWISANNKGSNFKYTTYAQDTVNKDILNTIESAHLFIIKSFDQYNFKSFNIVIGNSNDWVIQVAKDKLNNAEYPVSNGHVCSLPGNNSIVGCFNNETIFYIINSKNINIKNPGIMAIGAHEQFHVIQLGLSNYRINYKRPNDEVPAWFLEGSAEFVGYSYSSQFLGGYFSQRSSMFTGPSISSFDLSNYQYVRRDMYPYNIGRSAVEYLVASKGFQAVVDVFIYFGKGNSFANSFKMAYGIELKDFYTKFKLVAESNPGLIK